MVLINLFFRLNLFLDRFFLGNDFNFLLNSQILFGWLNNNGGLIDNNNWLRNLQRLLTSLNFFFTSTFLNQISSRHRQNNNSGLLLLNNFRLLLDNFLRFWLFFNNFLNLDGLFSLLFLWWFFLFDLFLRGLLFHWGGIFFLLRFWLRRFFLKDWFGLFLSGLVF